MRNLFSLVLALFLIGCARFQTYQTDLSYDKEGKPQRTITTKVTVSTFFDSTSELAKSKASQTDKTQSASLGSLNQSATSTNFDRLVESVASGAVQGAIKAAGKP